MSTEPVSADYDDPISRQITALLDDDRCRATISVLDEAPGPVPEAALAMAVAARTADVNPAMVDVGTHHTVHVSLHHRDLPKLEDEGLVDRDVGEQAVDITDRGRELARRVLNADEAPSNALSAGDEQDGLPILVALSTLDAPIDLRSLADALVDDHEDWEDPESAAIRLHHVDLPRLEDAGFLSYDATDRRVEIR